MTTFPRRLIYAMGTRTYAVVSEAARIKVRRLERLRRGLTVATMDDVEQLAAALGCRPEWLAFGVGK